MKQQINFRASDLTRRQIDKLGRRWGMNQSEVITVIVDRAYREETEEMNIYEVITKPATDTEPGAFVGIDFGEDGYAELVGHDKDGNEIYAIYTDKDISQQLDLSDGVIRYN